jgi:hypothetical protein
MLILKCPKCGSNLKNVKVGEMVRRDPATRKVVSVRRFPRGECPEHGMFDDEKYEIPGHHVTMRHLRPTPLRCSY